MLNSAFREQSLPLAHDFTLFGFLPGSGNCHPGPSDTPTVPREGVAHLALVEAVVRATKLSVVVEAVTPVTL